jgi:hypothetical protein
VTWPNLRWANHNGISVEEMSKPASKWPASRLRLQLGVTKCEVETSPLNYDVRIIIIIIIIIIIGDTRYRSWFRHCATSRKVAGSNPDEVIGFFN